MKINWIIDEVLAQSSYPFKDDLDELYENKIRAIVSLEPHLHKELIQKMGFEHLEVHIRDYTAPNLHQFIQINKFVDEMRSLDKRVLVHCFQAGRSGTICAGYLIHEGMTYKAAIMEVRRKIPNAIETSDQEHSLREYEKVINIETVVDKSMSVVRVLKWPKEKLMIGMHGIYRRLK
ncbi:protein-tyrosine phosphatase family protein [Candidatus Methanocrinis natronophilus]|nr:dual specificity protein phosphatase family protein [Candidatus Methanocrinis natronophilus]